MRLRPPTLPTLLATARFLGIGFLAALTFSALPACSSGDSNSDDSADVDAGDDADDIAGAIEGDPESDDGGEDLADEDQTAIYDALPDWDDATDGDSGAPGASSETLTDKLTINTDTGSLVNSGSALLKPCKKADGYSRGKHFTVCVTVLEGKLVSISTATNYLRMKSAHSSLRIVSGFRTYAEQVSLYNAYKAGRGNLAAKPGYSNHESGLALDLNTNTGGNYAWLVANGGKYGFRRTVPSEKWHWED